MSDDVVIFQYPAEHGKPNLVYVVVYIHLVFNVMTAMLNLFSVDTRTRRKPLAEISNSRTHPLEGSNDGLKLMYVDNSMFRQFP